MFLLLIIPQVVASVPPAVSPAPTLLSVQRQLPVGLHMQAAANGVAKLDLSDKLPLLVLAMVPVVFGSYATAVKLSGKLSDVHAMLLQCGMYTTAFFSVCVVRLLLEGNVKVTRFEWCAGIELGMWISVAATLESLGLQRTTATRAGFLDEGIVVPLAEAILSRQLPSRLMIAAVSSTILGMVLMVLSPAGAATGVRGATWSGDALVALSTVFYTLHIMRLGVLAPRCAAVALATAKSATQLVVSMMGLLTLCLCSGVSLRGSVLGLPPAFALTVLFTGIVTCAFPMWAQGYGQKSVRPAHASVIYATSPVWNAVIAALVLGERIAPLALLGACFLLLGMMSAVVASKSDGDDDDSERVDSTMTGGAREHLQLHAKYE